MRRALPIIVIVAVVAAAAWVVFLRARPKPGLSGPAMSLTILDARAGNGILLQTPERECFLFDPGSRHSAPALVRYLKSAGVTAVAVVITNPTWDHAGALPELSRSIRIRKLYAGPYGGTSRTWSRARGLLKSQGISEVVAAAGTQTRVSRTTSVEWLGPAEALLASRRIHPDEKSLVARIRHGGRAFLLMSDGGVEADASLISSMPDLESDVLVIGRHGRTGGTSLELLSQVRPQACVVIVGAGANRPHRAILERISARNTGAAVYRTDKHGIITIVSDGRRVEVRTREAADD